MVMEMMVDLISGFHLGFPHRNFFRLAKSLNLTGLLDGAKLPEHIIKPQSSSAKGNQKYCSRTGGNIVNFEKSGMERGRIYRFQIIQTGTTRFCRSMAVSSSFMQRTAPIPRGTELLSRILKALVSSVPGLTDRLTSIG